MRRLAAFLSIPLAAQVSFDRLRDGELEKGNWLTYSGNLAGHRFSPLREITPANAAGLRVLWTYQTKNPGLVQTSPVAVDGVLYVTEPPSAVAALDARTGRRLWRWERPLPRDLRTIGFYRVNRGVAVLGGMVYVGTLDNHLVALDATSGAVRWDSVVADYREGYSITCAPLAIRGRIVVGIAGGEAGIRGFVDAYEAETGKRVWRFWTVPAPGEPGVETWAGESWRHGAAATWLTGTYDPSLNLVYWTTGNPGPDFNGDQRAGDNLYSCSLLAIDAASGRLRWHFQFTPHDTHDWDATQIPVLIDASVRGRLRRIVAVANRNGFYYVLDRATGEFLHGVPFVKQTWAKGLDDKGRPIVIAGTDPSETGVLVWPSLHGGTNWFSPSYSPVTGLFYVAAREMGSYYYKSEAEFKPLTFFGGGGERALPAHESWGAIRALEVATGRLVWEFRLETPPWSGVMSTAGGVVFSGAVEGTFFALDARTGRPLWDFQTGGEMRTNPISFLVDGRQRVAMASGASIYVLGLR